MCLIAQSDLHEVYYISKHILTHDRDCQSCCPLSIHVMLEKEIRRISLD